MKRKFITVQREVFTITCKDCGLQIRGNSKLQAQYNMDFHRFRKHGGKPPEVKA